LHFQTMFYCPKLKLLECVTYQTWSTFSESFP
jgi:hypothetical protein